MSERAKRQFEAAQAKREYGEPQLLICHTCEARNGSVGKPKIGSARAVARDAGEHVRFMDQHRECARNGWGTRLEP